MNETKQAYIPSDYEVDIASFTRNRPLGVTGLMRVKNEARWVAASVDSCIHALDELIICYQECTDDTPAILERKRLQYPDKIKVYFYAPEVYAHNLDEEEFRSMLGQPENSIHLLSNYYNYTLSKATYRYALKIDADQIYFADRMQRLCDAYRSTTPRKATWADRMAYFYYRAYLSLQVRYTRLFPYLVRLLPAGSIILKRYENYCFSAASRGDVLISLSGINLFRNKGKWGVPAITANNAASVFNGCGDHNVFPVSAHSYYVPYYQSPHPVGSGAKVACNPFYKKYRIIERFEYKMPFRALSLGLIWYHMKFAEMKECEGSSVYQAMDWDEFTKLHCSGLLRKAEFQKKTFPGYHIFFYDNDKHLPSLGIIDETK